MKAAFRDCVAQEIDSALLLSAALTVAAPVSSAVSLGQNLFKIRVARPGGGKSGGSRVILAYRGGAGRIFILYVFAKNEKGNIGKADKEALERTGRGLISASDEAVEKMILAGGLRELAA